MFISSVDLDVLNFPMTRNKIFLLFNYSFIHCDLNHEIGKQGPNIELLFSAYIKVTAQLAIEKIGRA